MAVRQFKLQNALGNTFDLMRRDAFFYLPDGLGFRMDSQFMQIGGQYQLIETESAQKAPSGVMVFSSYSVYQEFAKFISYTPLRLMYKPINEWYYLDCIVSSLSKGEIDYRDNRLKCGVDFTATSKWYVPRVAYRTAVETVDAKQYTYQYNYTYADAINGIIDIVNNSTEDSPLVITILGDITDPAWALIVNNKTVQSGSITGNIPNGHKLVINAKDNELQIAEFVTSTNAFVANRYQDSDFTKDNFIYAPVGSSTLRIAGNVSQTIDAFVEIEEIHETV